MQSKYQDFKYVEDKLKNAKIDHKILYSDIGVSRQSWSGYKTSNSIPLEKALMISSWFDKNLQHNVTNTKDCNNCVKVKLYEMSASAGIGFDIDSVREMPFSDVLIDRTILPKHILSSDIVAMRVDGKSMIPTILPDEIVIYKEEIGKYSGDALYIVNFGGMLMVKRVQFNPELNKFDIISDNKDFKSYSVDLSDNQTSLTIIGKVIATIQQ